MSVGDLDFFQTLRCSLVPDLPVPSMSPIPYLDGQGWLSDRLSCAHGVWLGEDDMRRLAATGTTVALGADGAASNDNQNMWEVVKLTGILHRVYGQRSDWDSAETALRLCLQVAQQLSFPASRSWRQMPMNVRQSLVRVHRDRGFIMALG
jgi:cytosine/adenosine deaminase-related metal-dependent hydrolase